MSVGREAERARLQRFEELVLPHLDDLYRTALRLAGKAAEAEDLVQETCLRAFQCLDQLRHPGAAKVWVFSILRSIYLRQAERGPSPHTLLSFEDVDASLLVPSEAVRDLYESYSPWREAVRQEIRQTILRLPLPYREALVLAHVAGFSYKEMARILEVPMGTVMSRLFRARRMLRTSLRESLDRRSRPEPTR